MYREYTLIQAYPNGPKKETVAKFYDKDYYSYDGEDGNEWLIEKDQVESFPKNWKQTN